MIDPLHPVFKAGLEITSVSAIISYWMGYLQFLPSVMACLATTASFAYYALQAYYLYKDKNKDI